MTIRDGRFSKASPIFSASNLVDILGVQAIVRPSEIAYTFLGDGEREERHLTYSELDRQAKSLGALLQNIGAQGQRALLLYPFGSELEFIAAFFACLYSAVTAVPVYPPALGRLNRSLPRLMSVLEDAQPTIVFTTSSLISMGECLLSEDPRFRSIRWIATDKIDDLSHQWKQSNISSDTLAFLQYTSGSTSTPKGVMLTHENLLCNERMIQKAFGLTVDSIGVGWLPLYHDMGLIGNVIQPLFGGFRCFLMSPMAFLKKPVRWLQAISRYKATHSGGPNFAYELCVGKVTDKEKEELDLSNWRLAFSGAEPVRHESLQRFATAFEACGFRKESFYPCYGLAEATLIVTGGLNGTSPVIESFQDSALGQNQVVKASFEAEGSRTLVGCGQPLMEEKVVIVDIETLTQCSPNRVGEIWVSGPNVAHGYWNKPEETRHTFKAFLADTGDGPFLRTGDLGFFNNGELFITGRLKDLIIIHGRNHYPQDIELTVELSHPSLRRRCVAAFSIEVDNQERLAVVAEVERKPAVDPEAVIETIRQAVTQHHQLQAYAVVLIRAGSISKTSSGKIQRHACRRDFLAGSLATVGLSIRKDSDADEEQDELSREMLLQLAPEERESVLERYLQIQIARALRVAPSELEPEQSISNLGLDSLMAVELKYRIEVDWQVMVSAVSFLEDLTIRELTRQILDHLGLSLTPLLPARFTEGENSEHALSYNQQGLWFLHKLAPESAAYNLSFATRILSELDIPSLQRSFQTLINRHPVAPSIWSMDQY